MSRQETEEKREQGSSERVNETAENDHCVRVRQYEGHKQIEHRPGVLDLCVVGFK